MVTSIGHMQQHHYIHVYREPCCTAVQYHPASLNGHYNPATHLSTMTIVTVITSVLWYSITYDRRGQYVGYTVLEICHC